MDGPLSLTLPPNAGLLDVIAVTGQDISKEKLEEFTALARDVGPEREARVTAEREALDSLATMARTVVDLGTAIAKTDAELRQAQASAWDKAIQNPACDTRALAGLLRLLEDKVAILTDARDLLTYKRIPAAQLHRMESTLALRKVESLDAQLLAAISHGRTVEAMRAAGVFEEEGELARISHRTMAKSRFSWHN